MGDRIDLSGLEIRVARDRDPLVDGVSLEVAAGEILALVGASGSGKTLTCRSLLGMVDLQPGVVAADLTIRVGGDVLRPYEGCLGRDVRSRDHAFGLMRGRIVGYLAQSAKTALDPLFRVGRQVQASARLRDDGRTDPLPWLKAAGFSDPSRVADLFPHELSGGMAQRAVIAQALARGSRFLLADEPTTGLDPTVQAEILAELARLRDDGLGVVLVTHDLRILPGLCDRVIVLHEGRVAERLSPESLLTGRVSTPPAQRMFDALARIRPSGQGVA